MEACDFGEARLDIAAQQRDPQIRPPSLDWPRHPSNPPRKSHRKADISRYLRRGTLGLSRVQCGRWQKFSRMGGKALEEAIARGKKFGDRVGRFGGREKIARRARNPPRTEAAGKRGEDRGAHDGSLVIAITAARRTSARSCRPQFGLGL
jgi:hypothetical protein